MKERRDNVLSLAALAVMGTTVGSWVPPTSEVKFESHRAHYTPSRESEQFGTLMRERAALDRAGQSTNEVDRKLHKLFVKVARERRED
jgi:hypothetical protein